MLFPPAVQLASHLPLGQGDDFFGKWQEREFQLRDNFISYSAPATLHPAPMPEGPHPRLQEHGEVKGSISLQDVQEVCCVHVNAPLHRTSSCSPMGPY